MLFRIFKKDKNSKARLGIIKTKRGVIKTPCFVPVATKGALRGIDFENVNKFGADIFMVNTFHLFCNEMYQRIHSFGGLHKFIGINFPIMTDSGGFQVFSLGSGREYKVGKFLPKEQNNSPKSKKEVLIDNEGVTFKSPYDGSKLYMNPEISIKVQEKIGADFIFAFDECTSPLDSYDYHKASLVRTHNWAERSLKAFKRKNQEIFGIVQGGKYEDLRKESAIFINSLPFFGIGIGGSFGESFGDSKKNLHEVLDWTIPFLSDNKPRHLLGIGEPDDIIMGIERGIDSFDCVIPTRWARHGTGITYQGRINLKNSQTRKERGPIDKKCSCRVCKNYSRAYISHLLKEKEIYGIMLLTEHNLFWILNFMEEIRRAIKEDRFANFKKEFFLKWKSNS